MEELMLNEALKLHADIMADMRTAAGAMVNVCKNLKTMRDRQLYKQLGFERFEEYAEQMAGIKQRQAYTYIKVYESLSPKLLEEQAGAGITKLDLLCRVSAPEREEFCKENDISALSTKELEKLIEEKNGIAEQLTFALNEKKEAEREVENLKRSIAEKERVIEAKVIDTNIDEEIEKAVAEARQAVDAELESNKKEIADLKEKIKAEKEKAKTEKEKAKAEIDKEVAKRLEAEADKRAAELTAEKEKELLKAQERAAELAKRLEVEADRETTEFMIYFEDLQNTAEKLKRTAEKMTAERKEKMLNALKNALTAMAEGI